MNIIEIEHMKHYNKFISTYGMNKTHKQNKNKKRNKNLKLTRDKLITHKSKINETLHMLSNLKMMIYDYNI